MMAEGGHGRLRTRFNLFSGAVENGEVMFLRSSLYIPSPQNQEERPSLNLVKALAFTGVANNISGLNSCKSERPLCSGFHASFSTRTARRVAILLLQKPCSPIPISLKEASESINHLEIYDPPPPGLKSRRFVLSTSSRSIAHGARDKAF